MNYIVSEKLETNEGFTAYTKARYDIENILVDNGFAPLIIKYTNADRGSFKERTERQLKAYRTWSDACKGLTFGDSLVVQYPEDNDCTLLFNLFNKLRRKGVKVVALIHDLDIFRNGSIGYSKTKWILKKSLELKKLHSFSSVIVHNEKMVQVAKDVCNLPSNKLVSLDIFDYVMEESNMPKIEGYPRSVLIAGNLDKTKVKYLKDLPSNVNFELFGIGYTDEKKENIHYNGKFSPDELPKYLNGGFGLVWDGESGKTCSGRFGQYLKMNNPHKTSLYIASGIPVIIWDEAALSDFVLKNKCGITVKSLDEIKEKMDNLSEEDYLVLKNNALKISSSLRKGEHTINAINRALGVI